MNREIVIPSGAGVYPLTGDVASQAGSSLVTVTGLRGRTIASPFLQGGEDLAYDINTNQWVPKLRACIQVNQVTVSDDYIITVNLARPVKVNGV